MTWTSAITADDVDEIRDLISRYEAAWNRLDCFALRDLWADDDPEPWWFPEEVEGPLIGWTAIEAYWRECQAMITRFGLRTWDHHVKAVSADVAVAIFRMKWTAEMGAPASLLGGEVKVSMVLRRTVGGWRQVHYMEAALGPLPFVRAAYRAQAEPGLLGD